MNAPKSEPDRSSGCRLSLALSPNMKDRGRYTEVPVSEYPPIEQACVVLSSSKNKETA